jgi:Domain of unknown function (DUF4124)
MRMPKPQIVILATMLALTAVSTFAQHLYRCTDSSGRPYFTDRPPIECAGKELDELSTQGIVVNKRAAALTPEQYAAREAEQKRKKQEAIEAKEQARQDQALLSTYASVKDIDDSRQRALQQPEQALKDIGKRIDELRQRARKLALDKQSYANKPIPRTLRDDINDNGLDLKNQQDALAAKKKEISEINAKYGEDKQRYMKLTGAKPKAAAPATN